MSDSIRVVCRLRPLNKIEIANQGEECVTYSDKNIQINVGGDDNKYSFAFDRIFGPTTQQIAIYQEVAIPIIKSVISGFNGTIFAYGQTGGGKTWTMEGPNHHDPQFKGLIPRTIEGLFTSITQCDQNLQFLIKCSYIQIYNEKLFDLLDPSKARLQIKEDKQKGVFIQNCTEICVSTGEQMLKTMDNGSQNRKVAFTGMNQRSSRSHSLFIIHLFQKNLKKDSTKQSKLYFVDLAGSQKVSKTGVMGQQLEQAKNINKSLSSLGNVINALTSQKKQHIPYRDSKLTRILQESLGGNSRTTLIINCSMCTYNDKQTLSTLRFGYRAKSIKNKPKVNEQKSVKELLILLEAANKTIAELRSHSKGEVMPLSKEEDEEKDLLIQDLRSELENNKLEEEERTKEMELRIKQLMIELAGEKQEKERLQAKWTSIFNTLAQKIASIYKLSKRSYLDLQFCLNNSILNEAENGPKTAQTIRTALESLSSFEEFYTSEVRSIIQDILDKQKSKELFDEDELQQNLLTPSKKKSKIALSQPTLLPEGEFQKQQNINETLQMSCIIQKSITEENSYSDKISQESFSQIETMLESLETKESHKFLIEEMSMNMKSLKKENEELSKECEKYQKQIEGIALKIEEKYQEKIIDLEERVHEYKNVILQKDIEFTKKFDEIEKMKQKLTEEKVKSNELKRIIETNGNLKSLSEMETKVKSLVAERQKIFNELYVLRGELDDAEMSLKEKDEHIDSLKNVVKEISENPMPPVYSPTQIEKTYNTQIYGTQNPHIVQTIKGGKQGKKSHLRKKTAIGKKEPEQQKKNILPFFKTLFK